MNKINYLTLSGVMMALAGVTMLSSESIGISTSKLLVPLLFAGSGVLSYLFGSSNPQHKVASQYHKMQGGGLILFAILIAIIPQSLDEFLRYITYFMFFFALVEIIYGFMIINSDHKINFSILISRFLAGFFNLIGAVLILATSATDELGGLNIAGILITLGGLAFIVFSFKIRKLAPGT